MSGSEIIVEDDLNDSPGAIFNQFIVMEDLLDKLKVLDYEKQFLNVLKMKPLNKHYFALQTNPGEQFFLFSSLASWLARLCNRKFDQPQEYDDPNATIATILDVVRQMGANVNFPPNRLKTGFGENVIYILNFMADQTLKANSTKWNRIEPIEEPEEITQEIDDESELLLEKVEEEMAMMSDEDDDIEEDDGAIMNLEDLRNLNVKIQAVKREEILPSTVSVEEWQVELERVLPQLKVSVKTDARDWRSHLEQMKKHRESLRDGLQGAKVHLEKVRGDINSALEKISSREKHLNIQLENLLRDYQEKHEELKRITDHYQSVNGRVEERTKIVTKLTDELDTIKKEIDERSTNMTDGTPLVNLKKTISSIKTEMKEMDVRLGVLDSEILQARLRHKNRFHIDPIQLQVF